MPRGRPAKSQVRQNLLEVLYYLESGYGYDLYKVYSAIFPKVTMRLIYYHLQKGVSLGEIKMNKVVKEKGNYSWGENVEKIYYELGENARPLGNSRVKEVVDGLKGNRVKGVKIEPKRSETQRKS